MDLLDFDAQLLYFDEALDAETAELLQAAARAYGDVAAERLLLQAYFLEPEHLTVLVALYRYFYYQHRYRDALRVAERAINIVGRRLGLCREWRELTLPALGPAVMHSMTLTRFYLMVLKGAGYLELRLGEIGNGLARLEKVMELDSDDRLGVRSLVQLARAELQRQELETYPNVISI